VAFFHAFYMKHVDRRSVVLRPASQIAAATDDSNTIDNITQLQLSIHLQADYAGNDQQASKYVCI
jgi:hypothetical protein